MKIMMTNYALISAAEHVLIVAKPKVKGHKVRADSTMMLRIL